jgi:hypothetical protein
MIVIPGLGKGGCIPFLALATSLVVWCRRAGDKSLSFHHLHPPPAVLTVQQSQKELASDNAASFSKKKKKAIMRHQTSQVTTFAVMD